MRIPIHFVFPFSGGDTWPGRALIPADETADADTRKIKPNL
jgi:hypothetical protein